MSEPLLQIRNLTVEFGPVRAPLRVVDGVSLSINAGEAVGVVGESGSGKSISALSVLRLVPEPPARTSGEIIFDFAFALLVGVFIGTYSSIYVASPLLLVWPGGSGASRKLAQGKKSAAKA